MDRFIAFGYGKLVDLLGLYDRITSEGFSMEDVRKYLSDRTKRHAQFISDDGARMSHLIAKYAICPDCGAKMNILATKGGAVQTRFACTQCDLALDSPDNPNVFIKKMMEMENAERIGKEEQKDAAESSDRQEACESRSGRAEKSAGPSS